MMGIIITVDGPSGAGKGTLCYALAEKLGFTLLDSGAIYRVTALAAKRTILQGNTALIVREQNTLNMLFSCKKNKKQNTLMEF